MTDWSHDSNEKHDDSKKNEQNGQQESPDSSNDVTEKRKVDILKAIEKCESMGGDEFEAEQERIIRELNKQKETIKGLLDEIRAAKKERETHNIQAIFGK